MKNLLISLFTVFCFYLANAQDFSFEYGQVSNADIELKEYDKDKTAEAVVIYDKGSSYFVQSSNGFDLIFERSKRIKILTEAGIDYAEIEIPFYREGSIFEKIVELEAITHNFENGKLTRTLLTSDSWNDEIYNDYWMVRKFAMPNVKAGSIIEFKYKISSQYLFNLRDWEFQSRIPTIYSEYKAAMIPFYEYIYLAQRTGSSMATENYVDRKYTHEFAGTTYNDLVNKFSMKDIPAFDSEDYITSINDYIIKIDFQLAKVNYPNGAVKDVMSTWPKLIQEYSDHNDFGKYVKKCEKAASKIIDLNALKGKTATEKFDEIVSYVKNNFSWNEYNGKYASKSANDIVKDKFGNAADLNLLTIGLLRAAGIEATPVLISTRENGKVSDNYPFAHYFNYVVILASVDGKMILSDATDLNVANNRIPSRCINDQGLLVDPDRDVKWIGLQCKFPSISTFDFNIDLSQETSNVKVRSLASEYKAFRLKSIIGDNVDKLNEYLEEDDYKIDRADFSKVSNKDKEFRYEYDLTVTPETINEKLYIKPFLNKALSDNPLNQPTRSYPIDMTYPTKNILTSTIIIPEGYELDYQPENYKINNNLFELNYTVEPVENTVRVTLVTDFKESVYEAKDYSKIKFYFNEIVKRGNEKIVLKKI
ncbi:DUF3857 domain-containing protein [Draconibacterium sp. IB214405]|uniref:DUF3857 domain-containing protein n=1 Tax=Draconibacterium sp. IB214405 TaxID=3097352 RepID=UPI002A150903|nr:DUF3857 domain-containing protein [Draconibacterium sp. IB214405]MDX8340578.1 DUF3857 domain-containing protein [Draconibacterium sp. IB214405]